MTISLIKETDTCARCGADCAPTNSYDIDPLCTACMTDIIARDAMIDLPALHDLAFAMREPAAAMPINDTPTLNFEFPRCSLPSCAKHPF